MGYYFHMQTNRNQKFHFLIANYPPFIRKRVITSNAKEFTWLYWFQNALMLNLNESGLILFLAEILCGFLVEIRFSGFIWTRESLRFFDSGFCSFLGGSSALQQGDFGVSFGLEKEISVFNFFSTWDFVPPLPLLATTAQAVPPPLPLLLPLLAETTQPPPPIINQRKFTKTL
ncbi:hypothetical protein GLOIN_2v1489327 [Rhizophagus irregularis DAOM 181602=DAOM 197198]|uniref:Uncharacterized protein n=1 Tax=Rhizophagus irregularis (strain DAOM 181602 / DAOM 197198 / MUCL 43194) TaxID=747089 RepID=A0A2P4NTY4_RHIID|nr:hypothetical protein GLOIN_2v1489327 [Rhizophagus irregularis DAOM 181602=DAOM 197198]POG56624.1 hypothetical protein GLOIN_2v1489327 [Rhizophagus irregularis DAOM 181602=DAOM 197198]|eukprot:XP_025164348.1 hypothetical protein GLOIN_2v1489327 [Rhizophagus irregularis DAOM 181602=DAOM 197198]